MKTKREATVTKTGIALLVLSVMTGLLGLGCENPLPDGSIDDQARHIEGLIRLREAGVVGDVRTDNGVKLESAEYFARRVYAVCQEQATHPSLLGNDNSTERPEFSNCPGWSSSDVAPGEATTCERAVCLAAASNCVAEHLFGISQQVEDYVGRYPAFEVTVPPQNARANATLVEVAADYAARAIRVSGENLRSSLDVSPRNDVTFEGRCTPGDLGIALPGTHNQGGQYYGEFFLSTLSQSALLQTELAAALERTFSAAAEAE